MIQKGANMEHITDKQVVRKLIGINRNHMKITENSVRKLGIHRSQHHMLMTIGRNKGISQKDLAEKMEISTAAVAVTIKKLEQAGLVIRESGELDSRINNISLTEAGEKLCEDTAQLFGAIDSAMLEGFTEEERATLCALLDKLKDNLDGYCQD